MKEINTLRDPDFSCSIKYQYNTEDHGIYYYFETTNEPNNDFENYCTLLISKMTKTQKQFFLDLKEIKQDNEIEKNFVYCPGSYISSIYFEKSEKGYFNPDNLKDNLYIMKWIFSCACAIKILLNNNKNFLLNDKSIFIDKKMNARFAYANWEYETNKNSTVSHSDYFRPPEDFSDSNDEPKPTNEQRCAYSFGIFMISLLNRISPNLFFPKLSSADLKKEIREGKLIRKYIPECSWSKLINECLDNNPKNRPSIDYIIFYLLQEENCLANKFYDKFKKWVKEIFIFDNLQNKNEDDLCKTIYNELNITDIEDSEKLDSDEIFKFSDFPKFIALTEGTSFHEIFKKNCNSILTDLEIKPFFGKNKSFYLKYKKDFDPYILMGECLENPGNFDQILLKLNYALYGKSYLNLINLEKMTEDLSFLLRIYKNGNATIRYILPKQFQDQIFLKKFTDDPFFVKLFDTGRKKLEMTFYPFLNIYNILYNSSSTKKIEDQTKIKWLYQTAIALAKIHKEGYTLKRFSCQNIFIDLNLDAHFLPVQLDKIKSSNSFSIDFSNEFNYINSYYSPEAINSNSIPFSDPEKNLVYSYGVLMLELLHGIKIDYLLNPFSAKEKRKSLLKCRKVPFPTNSDIDKLHGLINSCLDLEPSKRKSFGKISNEIKELFPHVNSPEKVHRKDLCLEDLQGALAQGATISNIIHEYLYKSLKPNQKYDYYYMTQNKSEYSKFTLIWSILSNDVKIWDPPENIETNKSQDDKKSGKLQNKVEPDNSENIYYFRDCEPYANFVLNKIENNMIKIHKKPNSSYCHFGGLSIFSSRQVLIRKALNLDRSYIQKVDYVVKNTYNFPYGTPIKVKEAFKFFDDVNLKQVIGPEFEVSKSKGGDISIIYPLFTKSDDSTL